jgi:hypothetical protein
MSDTSNYIYALKDPRQSPAKPFYIGKGTGSRAWDHVDRVDETSKGMRIQEIRSAGHEVVVTVLADDLSEPQALKLEAELISAFGTEATGGLLTNSVIPSGVTSALPKGLVLPSGVKEKAQLGLALLKAAVLELAQANPDGVTNSEVARALGVQSEYLGRQKDYLSYSLLGLLMREGRVKRIENPTRHVAQVK